MSSTRFTLAENPQSSGCRSEGGAGLFVIQHIYPIAIIEVNLIEPEEFIPKENHELFTYTNSDGQPEHWQLSLNFCWQNIGSPDVDVPKLLRRAWHWYAAYMEWEDANIDNDLL